MNKTVAFISIFFMMNMLLAISSNDKVVYLNENDSILFNIYYLHKKPFDVDKELVWRTYSMILSVGNQYSVYYDMNKYRRDSLDNANLLYNPNFRSIRFTSDVEALELRLQRQDDIYILSLIQIAVKVHKFIKTCLLKISLQKTHILKTYIYSMNKESCMTGLCTKTLPLF